MSIYGSHDPNRHCRHFILYGPRNNSRRIAAAEHCGRSKMLNLQIDPAAKVTLVTYTGAMAPKVKTERHPPPQLAMPPGIDGLPASFLR